MSEILGIVFYACYSLLSAVVLAYHIFSLPTHIVLDPCLLLFLHTIALSISTDRIQVTNFVLEFAEAVTALAQAKGEEGMGFHKHSV
jgi:hypothetical protein